MELVTIRVVVLGLSALSGAMQARRVHTHGIAGNAATTWLLLCIAASIGMLFGIRVGEVAYIAGPSITACLGGWVALTLLRNGADDTRQALTLGSLAVTAGGVSLMFPPDATAMVLAVLGLFATAPQLRAVMTAGSVEGVSMTAWVFRCIMMGGWTLMGVAVGVPAVYIGDGLKGLLCVGVVVVLVRRRSPDRTSLTPIAAAALCEAGDLRADRPVSV